MPPSIDLSPGHFARLLLVALVIVTIALLAWQIVDVLLLVFGALGFGRAAGRFGAKSVRLEAGG